MGWHFLPRLHSADIVYIAGIVTAYAVIFGLLLPPILHDWPYSPYYNSTSSYMDILRKAVWVNDQRLEDAKAYVRTLPKVKQSVASHVSKTEHYDLVIVVITMSRERALTGSEDHQRVYNLGYLTQTVARLLQVTHTHTSLQFRHKKLVLCSVDPLRTFRELHDLSDYVETVFRYENSMQADWNNVGTENLFEKAKEDYAFCLRTAAVYRSPYYLVLEDDVLLADTAVETMDFVMKYFDLFAANDWLFVKMFYPLKWSGYSRSWQTAVELGGYAALGGSVSAGVVLLVSKCRVRTNGRSWALPLWFVAGGVFTVLLCVSIGRQNIDLWRTFLVSTHRLVKAPGCCTQAVLYPAHVVAELCSHLQRVHADDTFAVDIAIDGFAHIRGLKRYLIEPNIVQHIGIVSSVHRSFLNRDNSVM